MDLLFFGGGVGLLVGCLLAKLIVVLMDGQRDEQGDLERPPQEHEEQ